MLCAADVVIRERLKDVEKVENENVKLLCKVKNPKNYPVSWLKDENVLPQDARCVFYLFIILNLTLLKQYDGDR